METLAWLVRLRPEALAELQRLVDDPRTDPLLASVVLHSIGAAGTATAENVLATMLADSRRDGAARIRAARSMFQLREPTAEAVRATRELARDPHATRELAATGMLLLGALSKRLEGDARSAAHDQLLSLEERARRDGLVTDWLEALGNARTPRAIPAARR